MLQKIVLSIILSAILAGETAFATDQVLISDISGEVKIRRGLEETWQPARKGMSLQIIDSILTLEGEVILKLHNGLIFHLGANSMLDIGDLRQISEKEMFLLLMSEKVGKIPAEREKTKLLIGNISVVHGESKAKNEAQPDPAQNRTWRQEFNGAKALYEQKFYPNAVVKLHKIRSKYAKINDCGKINFLIGKSLTQLNEPGQAVDAYQLAIEQSKNCTDSQTKQRRREAENAVEELIKK